MCTIGRGMAYLYSSTRVVRVVAYGYYACKVVHLWSVRLLVASTLV